MKKIYKFFAVLLIISLIFPGIKTVDSYAAQSEDILQPINSSLLNFAINPNSTTHIRVPFETLNNNVFAEIFSIAAESDNSLITVSNLKIVDTKTGRVEFAQGQTNSLAMYSDTYALDFDVIADASLSIGKHTFRIISNCVYDNWLDEEAQTKGNFTLMSFTATSKTQLEPPYLAIKNVSYNAALMVPEASTSISFTVKNEGQLPAYGATMKLDFNNSGIMADYALGKITVGDIAAGSSTVVKVPVKISPLAEAGIKTINASLVCKNKQNEEISNDNIEIFITLSEKPKAEEKEQKFPRLSISTSDNYKAIKNDSRDSVKIIIENTGLAAANSITLTCADGLGIATGITKDFTSNSIDVGTLAAGSKKTVEFPIKIDKAIDDGLHELNFEIAYKDSANNPQPTASMTVYLSYKSVVKPTPTPTPTPIPIKNNITISDIAQTPDEPRYNNKVTVSFKVTNNGNADVTELSFIPQSLGSGSFEPIDNDPVVSVGKLKKGDTKKVSISLKCGESIPAGSNPLTIEYRYKDKNDEACSDSFTLYVLNVHEKPLPTEKPQAEIDVSRPKLIITSYSTDNSVLKAGEAFTFFFTFKNTHSTKAARNIKITLSQSEGVFSPEQGTNILYIDEIQPGESADQSVILKTRSDAVTGDYTLNLLVEYEYDNMSEADKDRGGTSDENNIKLRAIENYRPVIENIHIEAYDAVYVGTPVELCFEFYNMGKSTLGNVYSTVEGDFALANNSNMSYVGAVSGYSQEYVDVQVVPLNSGDCNGTLIIHFEDSNGDEITLTKEFNYYIEEESFMEGDFGDYGDYGDFGDFGEFGEDMPYDEEGESFFNKTITLGSNTFSLWILIAVGAVVVLLIGGLVTLLILMRKKNKGPVKEEEYEDY